MNFKLFSPSIPLSNLIPLADETIEKNKLRTRGKKEERETERERALSSPSLDITASQSYNTLND